MSRFTVVIPVYRSEDYLPACLDSLKAQVLADWDAVIVLDGSDDSSPQIARSYERADPRFSVVELPCNQGRHAARKAGVAHAKGEYACFLDSDDTFEPGLLAALDASLRADKADAIHFGMTLVSEDGMPPERSTAFERIVNAPQGRLDGMAALVRTFCLREGARDWRLTQRAYRRELLQRAFALTTDERLDVAEDAYEYFCVACRLQSESTCNDVRLQYHLGRGISGMSMLTQEELLAIARHYRHSIQAVHEWAARDGRRVVQGAAATLTSRLCEEVGSVWADRCPREHRLEAARGMAQVVGSGAFSAQVARIARDEAYAAFVADVPADQRDIAPAKALMDLARELAARHAASGDHAFLEEYEGYRRDAELHIHEVETGMVPEWRRVPQAEPEPEPGPEPNPEPEPDPAPRASHARRALRRR